MPESSSRKKAAYVAPPAKAAPRKPNPPWFVPVMVGLMVVGLAWIVVTYLSQAKYPIPVISQGNLAVGFVLILAGFGMTTRWR
ncbi:MAG TPA: cell division protein CrgA [Cellulomonas sp.]